jgi:hypothetical protein
MHDKKRVARGHGEDLGGTTIRSRFEQREARMMEVNGREAARGAEPSPDARMRGRVQHVGLEGAPTIYEEKPGGRSGGKGKRI